jgi:hypothetical protein
MIDPETLSQRLVLRGVPRRNLLLRPPPDALSLWNAAVTTRPALAVRCEDEEHVRAGVEVARDAGVRLSVRGGGHDWSGRALVEDGLVLDLRGLTRIAVDPQAMVARVGGGATSMALALALAEHGLTTPTGSAGSIGYAGLATGGGNGPLNGRFGLAADQLLGARLVTADGTVVETSATEVPDLFWAIRGGGGNFGVVVELTVRLHPAPPLVSGVVAYPAAAARDVVAGWSEVMASAPDELSGGTGLQPAPQGPDVAYVLPTWCGDPEGVPELLATLRGLADPVLELVGPATAVDVLRAGDDAVGARGNYHLRTRWFPRISPTVADEIARSFPLRPEPATLVNVNHVHGAATRVAPEATAFGVRRPRSDVEVIGVWPESADPAAGERVRRWCDELVERLAPEAFPGAYPNLLPAGSRLAEDGYGPNTARLLAVKAAHDPDGVFCANPLPTGSAVLVGES